VEFLKQGQRRYIVGTPKSMLKKYEQELLSKDWHEVHEGLEVRLCPAPDRAEVFILCRSAQRQQKEQAIHARFEKRIEEGLHKIETACKKRKQNPLLIAQRVGRLLGNNTRAAGLFQVQVEADNNGMARLGWSRSERWRDWARLSDGCYLLRSNVTDWTPEQLWRAYMQLTEAENAFHIQKSDLQIRPVWHQKAERVQAHILVCFQAYVLWKTLEAQCRHAGLGDEPRQVFRELSEIALVDIAMPTRNGVTLRKRCIGQPNQHQLVLLQYLGLRLPSVPEFAAV
jgi:transposase